MALYPRYGTSPSRLSNARQLPKRIKSKIAQCARIHVNRRIFNDLFEMINADNVYLFDIEVWNFL